MIGGMAEWFKAVVLKTTDEQLSESSNPSSSKKLKNILRTARWQIGHALDCKSEETGSTPVRA